MSLLMLALLVLVLAAAAFVLCRARVLAMVGGNARHLHSRPHYYGWSAALCVALPAFLTLAVWLVAFPVYVNSQSAATPVSYTHLTLPTKRIV